ncbi:MAG: signal peptidase I [Planctomycetota bacterium]
MTEPDGPKPAPDHWSIVKCLCGAEAPVLLVLASYLVLSSTGVMPEFRGLHLSLFVIWPLVAAGFAMSARRQSALVLAPLSALMGVLILCVTFYANFRAVRVEGDSMLPTLRPGDILLLDLTATPDTRFGIFVLDVEGEKHNPLIKRLVGLPGETVDVRFGRVFANELEVFPRDGTPPDVWNETRPAHARYYSGGRTLSEGEYFFLGDNPPDSRDSRAFGGVASSAVEGRVVWSLRGSHGFGRVP